MRGVKPFVVLWSVLISFQAVASDVVVMRDGSKCSGTLELCADDQCRLSGKRIPMKEIRAIYLDSDRASTKALTARGDAIVLRDGSVREGRVTFINRGTVDTESDEFDRSRVAAILFSAPLTPSVSPGQAGGDH